MKIDNLGNETMHITSGSIDYSIAVDRTDCYRQRISIVPPVITGELAKQIILDLQRPATELELAVLRRAMKNRIKRKERPKHD